MGHAYANHVVGLKLMKWVHSAKHASVGYMCVAYMVDGYACATKNTTSGLAINLVTSPLQTLPYAP